MSTTSERFLVEKSICNDFRQLNKNITQLNSAEYTPCFYIPSFYIVCTQLLFTFLSSEYSSNNRKIILSLKTSKRHPRTKEKSFLIKTKSLSFTTCSYTFLLSSCTMYFRISPNLSKVYTHRH